MNTGSTMDQHGLKAPSRKTIHYRYLFRYEDGREKEFNIELDGETLALIPAEQAEPPEWTKLKYSQCRNCPLPDTVTHCPVAVNLGRLVDAFRDDVSYESTTITVETPQRTYVKKTTLQKGLSSIIGVYMVTSDCPVLDKLRPMSRFHLPFATPVETFFRSISAYLTAQFLLMRKQKEPDWSLDKLVDIYKAINVVNRGMSERLLNASEKDANVNALVILHSFGDGIGYFIEDGLNEIEPMFSVFLKEHNGLAPPADDKSQSSST
ncbi:MAG: hypothetical protein WEB62_08135 [Bacteroidota bacterium]